MDLFLAFCLLPSCARTQGEDLSTNRLDLHQQLVSKYCCRVQETVQMCFGDITEKAVWKEVFRFFCLTGPRVSGAWEKTFTAREFCAKKLITDSM